MAYDVHISEQLNYLRVEITGHRITGQEVRDGKEIWQKISEACETHHLRRILAVFAIKGSLPIHSAFELAKDPAGYGFDRTFKLAYIDLNPGSVPGNKFAVTVAINRGYNVKFFESEPEALHWLLSN